MSADDQTSGERWLDMTNAAYDKVTGFLLQVAEPERQAMWIEVTGTSANQWTCNISLKPLDAAAPHDATARQPERRRGPARDPGARPAGEPDDRRARWPRRARSGRAGNRIPQARGR